MPLSVEIIHEPLRWAQMEGEWRSLFAAAPGAAPPLRWEWLWGWWQTYGPAYAPDGLRIVCVRRGTTLAAGLPLYRARPWGPARWVAWRFLSSGEAEFEETCAAHLDLLCLPGAGAEAVAALAGALRAEDWDELDLTGLPAGSPLVSLGERLGGRCRTTVTGGGECSVVDLATGFEGWLAGLSREQRYRQRRMLRDVEAAGLEFRLARDAVEASSIFEQLVALHQRRWEGVGKPGCFAAPRFTVFHRRLAAGPGVVLARLGEVAAVYGFRVAERVQIYQLGVAPTAGPLPSPGMAALLCLMRELAADGVTECDLLPGEGAHKERLRTGRHALVRVRVSRRGVRGAVTRVLQRCWRAPP